MSDDLARMLACRILHSPEQRFARLLLMIAEGIASSEIPLSRDTLTEMMGLSRSHLYLLTRKLGRDIVSFRAESLTIHAMTELEHRACSCFRGIYDRRWRAARNY